MQIFNEMFFKSILLREPTDFTSHTPMTPPFLLLFGKY